jgi:hypothetical protein
MAAIAYFLQDCRTFEYPIEIIFSDTPVPESIVRTGTTESVKFNDVEPDFNRALVYKSGQHVYVTFIHPNQDVADVVSQEFVDKPDSTLDSIVKFRCRHVKCIRASKGNVCDCANVESGDLLETLLRKCEAAHAHVKIPPQKYIVPDTPNISFLKVLKVSCPDCAYTLRLPYTPMDGIDFGLDNFQNVRHLPCPNCAYLLDKTQIIQEIRDMMVRWVYALDGQLTYFGECAPCQEEDLLE